MGTLDKMVQVSDSSAVVRMPLLLTLKRTLAKHALAEEVDKRVAAMAEDLRFTGVMVITDHGKPVHKRLMGIPTDLVQ